MSLELIRDERDDGRLLIDGVRIVDTWRKTVDPWRKDYRQMGEGLPIVGGRLLTFGVTTVDTCGKDC